VEQRGRGGEAALQSVHEQVRGKVREAILNSNVPHSDLTWEVPSRAKRATRWIAHTQCKCRRAFAQNSLRLQRLVTSIHRACPGYHHRRVKRTSPPKVRVNRRAYPFRQYESPRRPRHPPRASRVSCPTLAHVFSLGLTHPLCLSVRLANRVSRSGSLLAFWQVRPKWVRTTALLLVCTHTKVSACPSPILCHSRPCDALHGFRAIPRCR
jgi:hypothetical protein